MTADKEDPQRLELRASPQPVTRLNRKTIVVAASVIGATVLGVMLWSLQPKSPTRAQEAQPTPPPQQVARAEGLESLPRDYGQVPTTPRLGPPLGELGRPVVRAEQEAGIVPVESEGDYGFQPDHMEDRRRADRLQQVQEDLEAAKAQVFFQLSRRDSGARADAPVSPAESPLDRALKLIPSAISAQNAGAVPATAAVDDPNGQGSKQSFVQRGADSQIYGTGELQTPRSPYQVMAGTIVSAALLTGINSDLPGQIIGTITENIYDTVTGRFLLIPQGSRLLGQYDSEVAYGQRRVLLVWTRLMMPDGSSLTLDRLPGVDGAGYSGLEDR